MNFYKILLSKAKKEGVVKNVVGAIIINNDKVLMLSRKKDDFLGGIDELPSGNMELNESIYESLVREVKEEANLNISSVKGYINTFDYLSSSGKKARQYNFIVDVKDFSNIILTEHDDYKWFGIDDIRDNNKITDEVKYTLETCFFNYVMNKKN